MEDIFLQLVVNFQMDTAFKGRLNPVRLAIESELHKVFVGYRSAERVAFGNHYLKLSGVFARPEQTSISPPLSRRVGTVASWRTAWLTIAAAGIILDGLDPPVLPAGLRLFDG